MKPVTILNPKKLVFGEGCFQQFIDDIKTSPFQRIFLVTFPQILPIFKLLFEEIENSKKHILTDDSIAAEPTVSMFKDVLSKAQDFRADCVIGVGGGSVLDVAKMVAAMTGSSQQIEETFGIGKLKSRSTHMICLPTTSGTGSEMSPNAIFLDETDNSKKGIISPFLVPDASYIDPVLTISVPAQVTAATGLDALTHCLEAFTNKFSHPLVDYYAIEGIRLIGRSLVNAYKDGDNLSARTDVALGSMYGGMCLGPVNTAAVHALSYPLGSTYKIAHGLSNALLLPHVMRYNLPAVFEKYALVARALGAAEGKDPRESAELGINKIIEISVACNVPLKLSDIEIPEKDIPELAKSALNVQRLLVNNPREIQYDDAISIYNAAF